LLLKLKKNYILQDIKNRDSSLANDLKKFNSTKIIKNRKFKHIYAEVVTCRLCSKVTGCQLYNDECANLEVKH